MARRAIARVLTGSLAAAALAAGCSVELGTVPDMPTYQADVRPILMSHCVRCHGDPPLGDPASSNPQLRTEPIAPARFDLYQDTSCEPLPDGKDNPDCVFGAGGLFAPYIACYAGDQATCQASGFTDVIPMPPAPAAPLSKHQVEILARWAAETPAPLER